jgi:zinc protease
VIALRRLWWVAFAFAACAHAPAQPAPAATGWPDRVIVPTLKPVVSFRLYFRAGSIDDPPGKEGLTALTAELMAQGGTESLSAAQFNAALFPLAAELSAQVDVETTVIIGRVHEDLLDQFLPLLTDAIAHPRFDPKEFERLRGDAVDAITVHLRHNDDEDLGKAALQALIFGGRAYGVPVEGTVAGLKSITLQDVRDQWRRVFTRDRLVVGVAGRSAGDVLVDRVLQRLAGLPATGSPRPERTAPLETAAASGAPGPRALIVEKPTDSTAISAGYAYGLDRSNADYYPLWVGNSALGEHRQLGGILFTRLRELRGLNYGDYSYIEYFEQSPDSTFGETNLDRRSQFFSLWLRPVQNENRGFALKGAVYETARVVKEGLSDDEVARAKAFLRGYTLQWEAQDSRKLGFALDDVYYGTPAFLKSFRQKLPAITTADVNAALRRWIEPSRLQYALVTGDGNAAKAELASGRSTPIHYNAPKPPAILEEDKQIETLPLGLDEGNVRVVKADDLFETTSLPPAVSKRAK